MVVGGMLLWRALNVTALGGAFELPDERFLSEWTSPGINRCVRLTFAPGTCEDTQCGVTSKALRTAPRRNAGGSS